MRAVLGKIALVVCCLNLTAALEGAVIIFFGEDLNGNLNAVIPYPNANHARSLFFANLTGVGTETFESLTGAPPIAFSLAGVGTATLTGNGGPVTSVSPGTTNGYGRFPISGTRYFEVSAPELTIGFSSPIAAFGFYGTDVGDFGGQLSLTLTDVNSITQTILVPHSLGLGTGSPQDGAVLYFGFYDTNKTYTKIQLNVTGGGVEIFGLDDVSASRVTPTVPEPEALLLLGTGLAVIAGIRLRRQ